MARELMHECQCVQEVKSMINARQEAASSKRMATAKVCMSFALKSPLSCLSCDAAGCQQQADGHWAAGCQQQADGHWQGCQQQGDGHCQGGNGGAIGASSWPSFWLGGELVSHVIH
eukprot:6464708-Amphidinium_carterae.1